MEQANPKLNRIYHEHQSTPKVLQFVPGTGKYEGTYMLNLQSGKGDGVQRISVPLNDGEYALLMTMLVRVAAPILVGWTSELCYTE